MISMILTTINIFPLNLVFGFIGGFLWCLAGWFSYKDKALVIVEGASAIIYLSGIVLWAIK
jgi:hypothetical protein